MGQAVILPWDGSPITAPQSEHVWQTKNRIIFKVKGQNTFVVYPTEADNVGRLNAYEIKDKSA